MRLVFECRYCPAKFHQFKGLVKHYESAHNLDSEQYQKLRDSISYSGIDSGCQQATDYLGYPSSCPKCPFRKCVFDEPGVGPIRAKKRNRNEEIIRKWKQGESTDALAKAFGLSQRTVERVIAEK